MLPIRLFRPSGAGRSAGLIKSLSSLNIVVIPLVAVCKASPQTALVGKRRGLRWEVRVCK